jgi:hypothetical protein
LWIRALLGANQVPEPISEQFFRLQINNFFVFTALIPKNSLAVTCT